MVTKKKSFTNMSENEKKSDSRVCTVSDAKSGTEV